ncbi:hypothetical protein K402DRAFT_424927 [Aulographum hederae CBS 113979]|uniref:Uncharacterized protein n=1 Tax=Aulographum hederae CBS 113979 TaxID=1176131 RepID=A0A6G1GMG2_9PEZI|nr:hypothetical protein K402DRAFT_424927 [Aulographum hederae CBS 113979]
MAVLERDYHGTEEKRRLSRLNSKLLNTFRGAEMSQDPIKPLQNSRSKQTYIRSWQKLACYYYRVTQDGYLRVGDKLPFLPSTRQRVAFEDMWKAAEELYEEEQGWQFEGLAYSQEMLETWYKVTNSTANAKKREQLLSAFLRAKKRVAIATKDNPKAHFGIRQEYRVSHLLFMQFEEPEPPNDQTAPDTNNEFHRLYWQVSTRDASVFMANQVNWFLLAAEVLIWASRA